MSKQNKIFFSLLSISLSAVIYLFWWGAQNVKGGYYHNLWYKTDYLALACLLSLPILLILSLTFSWFSKRNLISSIPIIVYILLISGLDNLYKSSRTLNYCDFSVCTSIILNEDGTFLLRESLQDISYRKKGFYLEKRNTITLSDKLINSANLTPTKQHLCKESIHVEGNKNYDVMDGCYKVSKYNFLDKLDFLFP